mmetsp:Transcript_79663/g.225284  ORF Transcript_79663/g.225284 Transcript_79663/m.225284 type:complete len:211 (+) Transcript_79663:1057-1689(+)
MAWHSSAESTSCSCSALSPRRLMSRFSSFERTCSTPAGRVPFPTAARFFPSVPSLSAGSSRVVAASSAPSAVMLHEGVAFVAPSSSFPSRLLLLSLKLAAAPPFGVPCLPPFRCDSVPLSCFPWPPPLENDRPAAAVSSVAASSWLEMATSCASAGSAFSSSPAASLWPSVSAVSPSESSPPPCESGVTVPAVSSLQSPRGASATTLQDS